MPTLLRPNPRPNPHSPLTRQATNSLPVFHLLVENVRALAMWRNWHALLLLWGQFVSEFGNSLLLIAVNWYVIDLTGSPLALGVLSALEAGAGLYGFIAGPTVDRYSPWTLMLLADLSRMTICVALFAIVLLDRHLIVGLAAGLVLLRIAATYFNPAARAYVPRFMTGDQLAAFNGALQASISAGRLIGVFAGGTLFTLLGPRPMILIDAATFAASAFTIILLPRLHQSSRHASERPLGFLTSLREGQAFLWSHSLTKAIIPLAILTNACLVSIVVLLPAWVKLGLNLGPTAYSLLNGSILTGLLLGGVLAGGLLTRIPARTKVWGGILLTGLCVVLLGAIRNIWCTSALLALIGAIASIVNASIVTLLQTSLPQSKLGRVFATLESLTTLANPLGSLLSSAVATAASVALVWTAAGVTIALCGGVAYNRLGREKTLLTEEVSHD